jgi:hypothetical protein
MENGYLQGMSRIAWVKSPNKLLMRPNNGDIFFENSPLNGSIFPASICKSCKKIYVDYSEKKFWEC